MTYTVRVRDNFHYMDESEEYEAGKFSTADEAVAVAKAIVDRELRDLSRPGMDAAELYRLYTMFGEDPLILAPLGEPLVDFYGWGFARRRAAELAGEGGEPRA